GGTAGHARARRRPDRGGRAQRRSAGPPPVRRRRRPADLAHGAGRHPLLAPRARRPRRPLGRGDHARPATRALYPPPPGDPPMSETSPPEETVAQAASANAPRPVLPRAGVASAVGSRLAALL